ncbi:MAG TPA: protein kinase, partial [Pseudonocardiaceae bacterium]|nr:protein kinase [Pseudonocardiaceae bacterium]
PPAQNRADLLERLTSDGGLHPAAVSDVIPGDVDALVALATDPRVNGRFADVGEFLDHLDEIPGAGTDPVEVDPWNAGRGTELPDGSVVLQVLGTGATARAFHVQRDGLESVLKVGRSAQTEERLADEATALEGLRHEHLVMLKRGVFPLGARHAIELDHAGQRTLAQVLREDGALLPDQLQRFGDQLLDVLGYLHSRDTFHRDIKPDNLGVRTHPKRGTSLVLFDFSLTGAPTSDAHAGTRGYRDPFLGTDRRPGYDAAAERYAAAVTLHEMASRELPVWGEDGTDPRFVDQVTLSSELFDSALREPLTAFFRRACTPTPSSGSGRWARCGRPGGRSSPQPTRNPPPPARSPSPTTGLNSATRPRSAPRPTPHWTPRGSPCGPSRSPSAWAPTPWGIWSPSPPAGWGRPVACPRPPAPCSGCPASRARCPRRAGRRCPRSLPPTG